jgi:hypothetical protein
MMLVVRRVPSRKRASRLANSRSTHSSASTLMAHTQTWLCLRYFSAAIWRPATVVS